MTEIAHLRPETFQAIAGVREHPIELVSTRGICVALGASGECSLGKEVAGGRRSAARLCVDLRTKCDRIEILELLVCEVEMAEDPAVPNYARSDMETRAKWCSPEP